MRAELPYARAGQVIGLLGGSFDPAHGGHVDLTRAALRRFGLDRVWWLVSPGNPLKADGPAPLGQRMERAQAVMRHPKVTVTDVEARIGTRRTAQTMAQLQALYPGVRFVWLMGADNLADFHRWGHWREIMHRVPVGVIARPGDRISARLSRAARIYRAQQLSARASILLGRAEPPAWCFVNMPMNAQSSSRLRARGAWQR
ncbi:MAG: nicotinate-nucleotide adenylyltransferase [Salibaculum sp.]|jgi:nicotinate-nucleotide adenylyltransferase|uniref:nicotinate-nucleotide adenylyltransferase n=1 Tax=Salibaculum sp. TaxID=2855480 RepID=UPI00286FB853|nr:nicotinate-nucleotide adenylyltransferase [Salibaculum sp.]MDR9428425.1 nicotinate-nucleotide adenylyltransferase [Salibaculum sp.]MDR9483455.1 nicotinate-nucleotide adenylyltransferase [Salibaculum sp.]